MQLALTKNVKFTRMANAVAAGTTALTYTVDMLGFRGCCFAVLLGTVTSTGVPSVKLGSGAASNGSDAADIASSTVTGADDDDNQILLTEALDALPSGHRYLTLTVTRATANVVVDGVIAMQTNPMALPVTQDATTVVGSALVAG